MTRVRGNKWLFGMVFSCLYLTGGAAVAQVGSHANEPIGTVEQIYDGKLTPDVAINTYRNIDRLFPTRVIKAGETPSELPEAKLPLETMIKHEQGGKTYDLYDFLYMNNVTGFLVMKDGKVVYEIYQRGNSKETRWMSMSVAKSIASTLVGAAIRDGYIKSLDDNVVKYVPALAGSAYDGVSVRNVLMMSSGVKWNETYTDPESDRRDLLRAQIAQQRDGAMAVMAKLPRAAEPGTVNNYSTGETQVLAEIVYGAVGKPLAEYLSEKIWIPYGMEADANWWLDSPDGVEIGGSGLSATLRDYARFGQFFLDGGLAGGEQVLPEGWTEEASSTKTFPDGRTLNYGYMWWPIRSGSDAAKADKSYTASGIFGQYIHINPTKRIVIAVTGAASKPVGKYCIDPFVFFDSVARALD